MSMTDYPAQHFAFPDYFRKLFYNTGDLFPDFASAIGGGQNIYNFSYYGLFRPDVLISYLLPWVPMDVVLTSYAILLYLLGGCLMFYWIRSHTFPYGICLLMGFMFMSSSVLFQSHRQLMFVNYMPFLIISLLGVDKYLRDKKSGMLVIGIFLMILHSYYFSVSGIFISCIYFIYRYYHKYKIDYKKILSYFRGDNAIYKVFLWIFTAVMMAAFFLVPTALSMLENMRGNNESSASFHLLDFNFFCDTILHDYYGCGFSFFIWFTLCIGLTMKKTRLMSSYCILSMLLPIVPYLLNGTLYTHRKVYLTFIPVVLYLCGKILYLKQQKTKSDEKHYLIISLVPFIPILCGSANYGLAADALITIIILICTYKHKKAIYSIIVTSTIVCLILNYHEDFLTRKDYKNYYMENTAADELDNNNYRYATFNGGIYKSNFVTDTNLLQTSVYSSIQSKHFQDFMDNTMQLSTTSRNNMVHTNASNIYFQLFTGTKLLNSKKVVPAGYTKISNGLYTNNDVLPIAYGTSTLMSYDEYNKVAYPYTLDTLVNAAIVDSPNATYKYTSHIKEATLQDIASFPKKNKNVTFEPNKSRISINSESNTKFIVPLNTDADIIIFCATIDTNDSADDISVTINGIKEKISGTKAPYHNNNTNFKYVISSNKPVEQLTFECTPGTYTLSNIRIYTCNYEDISNYHCNITPLLPADTTDKQVLNGTLSMAEDGYFITSIPYQKGLEATIDGNTVPIEMVNTAYAGFPVTSGNHNITISFNAPGKRLGTLMSILGLLMCAFGYIYPKTRTRKS